MVRFFCLHQIYLNTHITSHKQKVENCPAVSMPLGFLLMCSPCSVHARARKITSLTSHALPCPVPLLAALKLLQIFYLSVSIQISLDNLVKEKTNASRMREETFAIWEHCPGEQMSLCNAMGLALHTLLSCIKPLLCSLPFLLWAFCCHSEDICTGNSHCSS